MTKTMGWICIVLLAIIAVGVILANCDLIFGARSPICLG